jgi:hypothetical protein
LCALPLLPFPNPSRLRLPSLFGPGLEPQTLRHNSRAGAGGESNCKTFRKLHGVAGPRLRGQPRAGRAADPGGHSRAASFPSITPLSAKVSSREVSATSLLGPPPRSGREGVEPRALPHRQRLGEGEAGPVSCAEQKQFLHVLFQHLCDPRVSVPGTDGV